MRKRKEGQRTGAKKVAADRKMDCLQKVQMTEEQKKMWNRKPYGLGK